MTILKAGDKLQEGDKLKRRDKQPCMYDKVNMHIYWTPITTAGRVLLGGDLMVCEYIRP